MVDIETLGTGTFPVILTIGAVKFDFEDGGCDEWYRRVDIASCLALGMTESEDTKEWWARQNDDARREALDNPDRVPISQALQEFSQWLGAGDVKLWAQGIDFDCVILREAFKACGLEVPWRWWNSRDLRTLLDIVNLNLRDFCVGTGPSHHALEDCRRQVLAAREAFLILNGLD